MAKYYISCGSLQMIYSTKKNVHNACCDVLWECNEHDVLDEYFYVDERGYRYYTNADQLTKVVRTEKIIEKSGWHMENDDGCFGM